ncbi:MAG: hypothetical protein FJW96_17455 [Actinobacteria bacterium]|nr:hypothetical protein [Actinomycetota bacterium]
MRSGCAADRSTTCGRRLNELSPSPTTRNMEDVEITYEPLGSESEKVVCWRLEVLRAAGFPELAAEVLAEAPVDLHEAVSLIRRGCSPELAVRILL